MGHRLRIFIGIFILVILLAILLSTPSSLVMRGVSLIDTELQGSSSGGTFVQTKMDFASPDQMRVFSLDSEEWTSTDFNASAFEKTLGADITLSRAYRHPSFTDPIFFMIMQSRDVSSFHPPPVCYRALGFNIEDEDKVEISVDGLGWAREEWYPKEDMTIYQGSIRAKKLVISKGNDGNLTEKRVVLYYYVRDEQSSVPKEITMIRASAVVPLDGSYQKALDLEKQLIADTFPSMFEPRPGEKTLARWLINEGRVLGWIGIAAMLLIPVGFMFYPQIKKPAKAISSNLRRNH